LTALLTQHCEKIVPALLGQAELTLLLRSRHANLNGVGAFPALRGLQGSRRF
jgi:hypothetical protein